MSKISNTINGNQSDVKQERSDLVTLTWENLNVHVPQKEGLFGKIFKRKNIEQRYHIVQDVNGIAKPGQILAIMGASGAGKTTLLNVLTFRSSRNLTTTGSVKVNGRLINDPSELASISAYVEQDDIFIGTLKVKEHLKFQAMLRMGRNATTEEKNARVEEVLNELNLKKCEDTLIGLAQLGIKGISGGERRRLAFASEIITNPSLLFCDEPTSGLDSFMAMSIVDSMKELANRGKTIICTIHQPSSEIFVRFDRLFLMAEGRLAYTGDLVTAHQFFSSQNYRCPPNYNPAEFYIKTLAISPFDKENCQERVKMICDGFQKSTYFNELNKDIFDASSNFLPDQSNRIEYTKGFKSNSFVQLKWLIWRDFLGTLRNPLETKINLFQIIFMAIIMGLIYLQLEYNQEGVQNINGVIFLILTNTTFGNLFPVLNSFPKEIPIFLRENKNGMYRVISYYMAKFFNELPKFIISPFIFICIVYWMCNLNNDAIRFLICCGTIILVANATVAFGSFISAASPSVNAALAISSPILAPLMIFSGNFLNNKSIPDYFVWVKYISWLSYSNEILVINQWKGINHIECEANSTLCYNNGDQVIKNLGMNEDNYYTDFICLGALIVGFRLLAYICLEIKAKFN